MLLVSTSNTSYKAQIVQSRGVSFTIFFEMVSNSLHNHFVRKIGRLLQQDHLLNFLLIKYIIRKFCVFWDWLVLACLLRSSLLNKCVLAAGIVKHNCKYLEVSCCINVAELRNYLILS